MDPFQVLKLATAASAEGKAMLAWSKTLLLLLFIFAPRSCKKKTKSHRYEVGEPLVGSISSRNPSFSFHRKHTKNQKKEFAVEAVEAEQG